MERPLRQFVLMQSAYLWAQRSTCSRLHVGCVMEREGRILVQGYNGAPAGLDHCDHACDCGGMSRWGRTGTPTTSHDRDCNTTKPCLRAVHAEQNAIAFAARHGVELEGASAWITNQPCMSCAQSMINAGIKEVFYFEPYRLQDGVHLLEEAGIKVSNMQLIHPEWVDRMIR